MHIRHIPPVPARSKSSFALFFIGGAAFSLHIEIASTWMQTAGFRPSSAPVQPLKCFCIIAVYPLRPEIQASKNLHALLISLRSYFFVPGNRLFISISLFRPSRQIFPSARLCLSVRLDPSAASAEAFLARTVSCLSDGADTGGLWKRRLDARRICFSILPVKRFFHRAPPEVHPDRTDFQVLSKLSCLFRAAAPSSRTAA